MGLVDFVNRMNSVTVLITALDRDEYSQEFLEKCSNSFKIIPTGRSSRLNDPILKLVHDYDCTHLEIGDITISKTVTEDDIYYFFGGYGGDELAINKKTREIELREYGANHTLSFCSKNSVCFLNAIAVAAEFISQIPLSEDMSERQETVCRIATTCTIEAGGRRYSSFYKMLLGCET